MPRRYWLMGKYCHKMGMDRYIDIGDWCEVSWVTTKVSIWKAFSNMKQVYADNKQRDLRRNNLHLHNIISMLIK